MVHFLVECFPRELIVIELHTLESFSSGSCVRCSEAESVWERGSDVPVCRVMLNMLQPTQVRGVEELIVVLHSPRSALPPLVTRFGRMKVRLKIRDVHNVENFVLCSSAHHACSPLSQEGLLESF